MFTIEAVKTALFQQAVPAAYIELTQNDHFISASIPYSGFLAKAIDDKKSFLPSDNGANLSRILPRRNISQFGRSLRQVVQGRTFVDLGCSYPTRCPTPRVVAQFMDATQYIGVDGYATDHVLSNEFPGSSQFHSFFLNDDILSFLAKLGASSLTGVVFYIKWIRAQSCHSHKNKWRCCSSLHSCLS